jgi:hypothetical protein
VTVVGVAWKSSSGFPWLLIAGEDRNTVPGFLAVPDSAIPGALDLAVGKLLIRRLQFLQADDIWFRLGKPTQQHV